MSDIESESENAGDMIQNTRSLRSTSNAKKSSEAQSSGQSVIENNESLIQILLSKMDQNTLLIKKDNEQNKEALRKEMDKNALQVKNEMRSMDKNLQDVNINMNAMSANIKQTNFVMAQNKETLNAKIDYDAQVFHCSKKLEKLNSKY